MRPLQLCRAALVLVVVPPLTLLISIAALVHLMVFRGSSTTVQALPRAWAKIILGIAGVTVRVEGAEKLNPRGTYIFAANHQSQLDILALQGWLGFDFRWLAKKELFQVPVWGAAMRRSGSIPVNRGQGRAALRSLDEAAQRIADGTSVAIFPEGTRTPDGRLQPFKGGAMVLAIKSGVPVVPVGIAGTFQVLPKGSLLVRRTGEAIIRLGEPIQTAGFSVKQKQELAERLQGEVARLL
ncbi:MAG: lysophospholipid acyltransferase family protein [Desulfobacteraceae bacterium]|nr:lysophospholipid acyltransferase family protein [Desulfobacteraceae bacterium]